MTVLKYCSSEENETNSAATEVSTTPVPSQPQEILGNQETPSVASHQNAPQNELIQSGEQPSQGFQKPVHVLSPQLGHQMPPHYLLKQLLRPEHMQYLIEKEMQRLRFEIQQDIQKEFSPTSSKLEVHPKPTVEVDVPKLLKNYKIVKMIMKEKKPKRRLLRSPVQRIVVALVAPMAMRTQMNMMASAFLGEIARKMFFPVAGTFLEGIWPSRPPSVPGDGKGPVGPPVDDRPSQGPDQEDDWQQQEDDWHQQQYENRYRSSSSSNSNRDEDHDDDSSVGEKDSASHHVLETVSSPEVSLNASDIHLVSLLSSSVNGSHVLLFEIPRNYKEVNRRRGHAKGLEDSDVKLFASSQGLSEGITSSQDQLSASIRHDKHSGDLVSKVPEFREEEGRHKMSMESDKAKELASLASIPMMFAFSTQEVNDSSRRQEDVLKESQGSHPRDTIEVSLQDASSSTIQQGFPDEENDTECHFEQRFGHVFETKKQLEETDVSTPIEAESQTGYTEDAMKHEKYNHHESQQPKEDTTRKRHSLPNISFYEKTQQREHNSLFGFPGHIIVERIKQHHFNAQDYDFERARKWQQILKDSQEK